MKSRKKCKKYYANSVGIKGLQFDEPVVCSNKFINLYWDDTNSIFVDPKKLGLDNSDLWTIQFSSTNKRDVEIWTQGVFSAIEILKRLAKRRNILSIA